MTNSGEDIRTVRSSTLNAVSVVDPALAGLRVDVEELQVVVEVHITSTKVTAKQGGVGGEDGSDVEVALANENEGYTCQPFVDLRNNGRGGVSVGVVEFGSGYGAGVFLPVRKLEPRIMLFSSTAKFRAKIQFFCLMITSPRNHATKYPNTIASFVSWSSGGLGIPAIFHRSAFHSFIRC